MKTNRNTAGFTLVELMLTIVLLSIGILSLAGTSALIMRQMGESFSMSRAATAAQSRLEALRGVACTAGTFANGTATTAGIEETWTVATPGGTNTSVTVRTLIDSVTYSTPRGKKSSVFRSYHSC